MGLIRQCLGLVMSIRGMTTLAWKAAYVGKFDRWISDQRFDELQGRRQLHEYVMTTVQGSAITYLEFGVHKGESLRWWLDGNHNPHSRFVGFDSFEGLPETWRKDFQKGHFSTGSMVPDVDDPRCSFEVGWFQDTLPRFIDGSSLGHPIVAHLDADLYSSTLFVLFTIAPVLAPGDILILDDFPDTLHVFRALTDFLSAYPIRLRAIAKNTEMRRIVVRVAAAGELEPAIKA